MRKKTILSLMTAAFCAGMSIHALAGQPFFYKTKAAEEAEGMQAETPILKGFSLLPAELYIEDDGEHYKGSGFSFGSVSENTFYNPWAGYRLDIPKGYVLMESGSYYDSVYYTPDDAVTKEGAAFDFALVSPKLSEEMPDPENPEDNAAVLLSFFTDGEEKNPAFDPAAYAERLILKAANNPLLLPYMERGEQTLANTVYEKRALDYEAAMMAHYKTRYQDGKEHPVFDERFSFSVALYWRKIGDKYHFLYQLNAGAGYEEGLQLLDCLY